MSKSIPSLPRLPWPAVALVALVTVLDPADAGHRPRPERAAVQLVLARA
jgi:hypothetical protein